MIFFVFFAFLLGHASLEFTPLYSAFLMDFNWKFINFTWNSVSEYHEAISAKTYIPQNNFMVNLKFYKSRLYIVMPRVRAGTPVTMGSVRATVNDTRTDPLVTPFPSWEMNKAGDCSHLLNVQSMEIDKNGTMWVLDGIRITSSVSAECPSKLVLFDLSKNSSLIHSFDFPEALSAVHGGYLKDIVIDDTDGDFAYISDVSNDPGIIVYSRKADRSWKLHTGPTNGIALAPRTPSSNDRTVFFCNAKDVLLHSISTNLLKNQSISESGEWKTAVRIAAIRQSRSDGLIMDNSGDLYYGLIDLYGVGRWNIHEPFSEAIVVDTNSDLFIWPGSFAIDNDGYLYLLMNYANEYFDVGRQLNMPGESRFRVSKIHTGHKSYLYSNNSTFA